MFGLAAAGHGVMARITGRRDIGRDGPMATQVGIPGYGFAKDTAGAGATDIGTKANDFFPREMSSALARDFWCDKNFDSISPRS